MSIYQRGDIWYMNFIVKGIRVNKSTGKAKKREAEAFEAEAKRKLTEELSMPESQRIRKLLLSEAIEKTYHEKWINNKDGEATYSRAKKLVDLISDKPLAEITSDDITRMVRKLKADKKKNGTINRYLAFLRLVLNLGLKKWGALNRLPYISLEKEVGNKRRVVTPQEETALIKFFTRAGDREMADLVVFLIDTGVRLSNALNLRFKDVNFETRMIDIIENKADNPEYSIPMTERVFEILQKRQQVYKIKPFRIGIFQVEDAWQRAKKQLGLEDDKGFCPHALRHTTASRLISKGVDLLTVKDMLGHKSYTTTLGYIHMDKGKLVQAVKVLEGSKGCRKKCRDSDPTPEKRGSKNVDLARVYAS